LDRLLPYFGDKLLKEITPTKVEAYRQARLAEPSGRTPQTLSKPATVNRELACFKTIFKAIANGKAECNPAAKVKLLKENNERDRILSSEEYIRLQFVLNTLSPSSRLPTTQPCDRVRLCH
jgi:site-specific recombinase XerD